MGSFHYHIFLDFHIRISIYHLPFTIFHIRRFLMRYLHLQPDSLSLYRLITWAHTFSEGRATAARPRPTARASRRPWAGRGTSERFLCKCSLCKSLRTHDRCVFFFFCFPSPPISTFRSIMNYWSIGSLSKYKLSNKFERVLHLM